MRGIDSLIKMRLRGDKPSCVWVEMLPMQKWTRQYTDQPGQWVDLHMSEDDVKRVDLLDLRCLIGLNVTVQGEDKPETEQVARACFKAGANVVQAMFYDISNPYRIQIIKGLRISKEGEKLVWQQ
jgi:hypothetical protein